MHPWLHFRTITKHKLLVMKYCFRIGLYKQGLLHDLSKYSPAEFLVGCRYYQGREALITPREKISAYLPHGFTTRAGTSTILSTGWITLLMESM